MAFEALANAGSKVVSLFNFSSQGEQVQASARNSQEKAQAQPPSPKKSPSIEFHQLSEPLQGRVFFCLDFLKDAPQAAGVCKAWLRLLNPTAFHVLKMQFPLQNRVIYLDLHRTFAAECTAEPSEIEHSNPLTGLRNKAIAHLKRCEQFTTAFAKAPSDPRGSETHSSSELVPHSSNANGSSPLDLFAKGTSGAVFSSSPNDSSIELAHVSVASLEPSSSDSSVSSEASAAPVSSSRSGEPLAPRNSDLERIRRSNPRLEEAITTAFKTARKDIRLLTSLDSSATQIFTKVGRYDPNALEDYLIKISQAPITALTLREELTVEKLTQLLTDQPENREPLRKLALSCSAQLEAAYEAEQSILNSLNAIPDQTPAWTRGNLKTLWAVLSKFADKSHFKTITLRSFEDGVDEEGLPNETRFWESGQPSEQFFAARQRIILGLREMIQDEGCNCCKTQ